MSTPSSLIAAHLPSELKPSSPHAFNPATSIPSQARKVFLITGATTGIGRQTALELAAHESAQLWISGRNVQKGEETVAAIKNVDKNVDVRFVTMDLSSFDSVKHAAEEISLGAKDKQLDVSILNAGIMAGPPTLTPSGYESNFGTNHMGHALLLRLLLPLLEKSPSPRVIFMASRGHSAVLPPGGIIFDRLKTPQEDIPGVLRYTSSKLANVVYARQVAVKYPHIVSVAIHPEDVATELFTKGVEGGGPEMEYLAREVAPKVGVSVFEGAKHGLWAATTEGVESGRYYEPVGMLGKGSELSRNKEFGDKLWEWTEKELERVEM